MDDIKYCAQSLHNMIVIIYYDNYIIESISDYFKKTYVDFWKNKTIVNKEFLIMKDNSYLETLPEIFETRKELLQETIEKIIKKVQGRLFRDTY